MFENYPFRISCTSVILAFVIYFIGAFIMSQFGALPLVMYIVYCLWMEYRLLKFSCAHCYYYGKNCGVGRGQLCALLFKKGDPKKFSQKEITWKDLLPDLFVSFVPILFGIIFLIRDFSILILFLMVVLFFLSFMGNAIMRGQFLCPYCKQKELGCPAEKLFNKQGH